MIFFWFSCRQNFDVPISSHFLQNYSYIRICNVLLSKKYLETLNSRRYLTKNEENDKKKPTKVNIMMTKLLPFVAKIGYLSKYITHEIKSVKMLSRIQQMLFSCRYWYWVIENDNLNILSKTVNLRIKSFFFFFVKNLRRDLNVVEC